MRLKSKEIETLVALVVNDGRGGQVYLDSDVLSKFNLLKAIAAADNRMRCAFYASDTASEARRTAGATYDYLAIRDRAEQILIEDKQSMQRLIDEAIAPPPRDEIEELQSIIRRGGGLTTTDTPNLTNSSILRQIQQIEWYDRVMRDPDLYFVDRDSLERSIDKLRSALVDKSRRVLYRGDYYGVEHWLATRVAVEDMTIPTHIGRVEISPEAQATLRAGGAIYVDGMYDSRGGTFSAYVKLSDDRAKLEYSYQDPEAQRQQSPSRRMKM